MKTLKKVILALIIGYISLMIIAYSEQVSQAVIVATQRCLNIIVPSLFAFMVISDYAMTSGVFNNMKLLFRPLGKLLALPDELVPIFIFANLGGYPVGISLLTQCVKSGKCTKRTAEVMSCYCFGAGPAFVMGAVGYGVFSNKSIGIAVFISVVSANTVIAMIVNRMYRKDITVDDHIDTASNASLVSSIEKTGKALFKVCLTITAFSVIITLLHQSGLTCVINDFLGLNKSEESIMMSILEISSLTSIDASCTYLLPIICSVITFGGICVLLQIVTINCQTISLFNLLVSRIPTSMLTFLVFKLFFSQYITQTISVMNYDSEVVVNFNNFIPSICLIIMIILLYFRKRLVIKK